MAGNAAITVEAFYRYGYRGRDMIAIRSPFATSDDSGLIGRHLRLNNEIFEVRSVLRQVSGAIQQGEPIGVEVFRVGSLKVHGAHT